MKIHHFLTWSISRWIFKFYVFDWKSFLINNSISVMNTKWEKCPILSFLVIELKSFQIRRICAKKIDNNLFLFFGIKVAINQQYENIFSYLNWSKFFRPLSVSPYYRGGGRWGQKIHYSKMVHPRTILLTESMGNRSFFRVKVVLNFDFRHFLEKWSQRHLLAVLWGVKFSSGYNW